MINKIVLEDVENLIERSREAFDLAEKTEKDNGYEDAMLSMDRTYCQGYLDALQDVRIILNARYNG